jgi:hypothetical protein
LRRFCLAIAAGEAVGFGPQKAGLKNSSDFGPSQQLFPWSRRVLWSFPVFESFEHFLGAEIKMGKGERGASRHFWAPDANRRKVWKYTPGALLWRAKKKG